MTPDKSKVKEDFKLHRYNKSGECIVDGHGTHCPKKSSEAGFTPGPWNVMETRTEKDDLYSRCWVDAYGSSIKPAEAYGNTKDEAEANAALIASAPELLEACKNALALIEYVSPSEFDMSGTELQKELEPIRQAISKAGGC